MLKLKSRLLRGKDSLGFSFLELVIVVAVVGLLTAIAIPSYGAIQNQAKQAAVDANALTAYKVVLASQVGYGPATSAPAARLISTSSAATVSSRNQTPDEIIAGLVTEQIDLKFINDEGEEITYPGDTFCVRAHNIKEPKYQALEGDCPADPNAPAEPTNPNPTDPVVDAPERTEYATTKFAIRCSTAPTRTMNTPVYGFKGTYTVTNVRTGQKTAPTASDLGPADWVGISGIQANTDYILELDGTFPKLDARIVGFDQRSCWQGMPEWGTESGTTDASFAFFQLPNFNEAPKSIPATVTNVAYMFGSAPKFNQNIESWDMVNVTKADGMFNGAEIFDQPLNKWNMSKNKHFSSMFEGARAFDQPLNDWNLNSATGISTMFKGATSFNQPLDKWNTSGINSFDSIFEGANSFNQSVNSWDTRNALSMKKVFYNAWRFNQPLDNWKTDSVTSMAELFYGAMDFNRPIGNWKTGNVTDMTSMFYGASSFNQPLNDWDVSKVTAMNDMFNVARAFNQPLDKWNTGNVTGMQRMFRMTDNFSQDISNWNVSKMNGAGEFRYQSAMTAAQSPFGV